MIKPLPKDKSRFFSIGFPMIFPLKPMGFPMGFPTEEFERTSLCFDPGSSALHLSPQRVEWRAAIGRTSENTWEVLGFGLASVKMCEIKVEVSSKSLSQQTSRTPDIMSVTNSLLMRKKAQESNGAPCYYSLLTGIQNCHGIAVTIPPKRENHVKTHLTSSLWGFL